MSEIKKEGEKKEFLRQRDEESSEYNDYFFKNSEDLSMWREDVHSYTLGNIPRDWVYMYQDKLAFRILNEIVGGENKSVKHKILDVGSMFYAALFFGELGHVTYLEPRLGDGVGSSGEEPGGSRQVSFRWLSLSFIHGEGQRIPSPDSSYNSVTCLHALEHFGLGRYGDTIDYYGDQKALREFNRVLDENGTLLLSVPTSDHSPRIEFNGQRVYNPDMIDDMLDSAGFEVATRYYISSLGLMRDENGSLVEPLSQDRNILRNVAEDQQAAYFTLSVKR